MATAIDFLTPTDLKIDRFTKDCFRLIFQLENTPPNLGVSKSQGAPDNWLQ